MTKNPCKHPQIPSALFSAKYIKRLGFRFFKFSSPSTIQILTCPENNTFSPPTPPPSFQKMCHYNEVFYACRCPQRCRFIQCKEALQAAQNLDQSFVCPQRGKNDKRTTLKSFCDNRTCGRRRTILLQLAVAQRDRERREL